MLFWRNLGINKFGLYFPIKSCSYCRKVAKVCVETPRKDKKKDYFDKEQLKGFGRYVTECLPKYVQQIQLSFSGEMEIMVVPEGIFGTLQFLKDHHNCQFEVLADVTSIDVLSRPYRFELSYNLLSLRYNSRIRASFRK